MQTRISRGLVLCLLTCAVAACGGGSSADPTTGSPSSNSPPPPSGSPAPAPGPAPAPTPTPPTASSWTVRLAWDGIGADPTLVGYRLYHGATPAADVDAFFVGPVESIDYETTEPGTHYFAVVAVAADGTESPRSSVIAVPLQ
jgi:hypothetical protein